MGILPELIPDKSFLQVQYRQIGSLKHLRDAIYNLRMGSLKTCQLLGAYTTLYCALWHIKAKDYDNKMERILFGGQINDFP